MKWAGWVTGSIHVFMLGWVKGWVMVSFWFRLGNGWVFGMVWVFLEHVLLEVVEWFG